jgi:hypothetical protein
MAHKQFYNNSIRESVICLKPVADLQDLGRCGRKPLLSGISGFYGWRVRRLQPSKYGAVLLRGKKKVKQSHNTHMEAQEGRGCTAPTHSRPRHKMEVSGQRHAPAALYPRDPLYRNEAGWDPELVWTQRLEEKSFASAADRTWIARSSSP